MNIEELLEMESDEDLIAIQRELATKICPKNGYAHSYCKKVNKRIDNGLMEVNNYRKIYLPSLTKLINQELAQRYVELKANAPYSCSYDSNGLTGSKWHVDAAGKRNRIKAAPQKDGNKTEFVITGKLRNGKRFKPIHTATPWNYNIWSGTIWQIMENGTRKKIKEILN
jgi:hypothetical protein